MAQLLLLAQAEGVDRMFGTMSAIMIVMFVLAIAASVFWLWMLIDALVNEPDTGQKILWFLVIFFLHLVGAIIYFAIRKAGPARRPTAG